MQTYFDSEHQKAKSAQVKVWFHSYLMLQSDYNDGNIME